MIKINDEYYYYPHQLLGSGNFGKVFKGYSIKKNKIIAIKIS